MSEKTLINLTLGEWFNLGDQTLSEPSVSRHSERVQLVLAVLGTRIDSKYFAASEGDAQYQQ